MGTLLIFMMSIYRNFFCAFLQETLVEQGICGILLTGNESRFENKKKYKRKIDGRTEDDTESAEIFLYGKPLS